MIRKLAGVTIPTLLIVLLCALASGSGAAQAPQHPAYIRALADLKAARAHLDRPDHGELAQAEKDAVHEINEAINEIKNAAIDDHKNPNEHVAVDANLDWPGRLHQAAMLLDKAHADVGRDEDNKFADGLQQRALKHIDKAKRDVFEAIRTAQSH